MASRNADQDQADSSLVKICSRIWTTGKKDATISAKEIDADKSKLNEYA